MIGGGRRGRAETASSWRQRRTGGAVRGHQIAPAGRCAVSAGHRHTGTNLRCCGRSKLKLRRARSLRDRHRVSLNRRLAPSDRDATRLALTTVLRRKGRVLDAVSQRCRLCTVIAGRAHVARPSRVRAWRRVAARAERAGKRARRRLQRSPAAARHRGPIAREPDQRAQPVVPHRALRGHDRRRPARAPRRHGAGRIRSVSALRSEGEEAGRQISAAALPPSVLPATGPVSFDIGAGRREHGGGRPRRAIRNRDQRPSTAGSADLGRPPANLAAASYVFIARRVAESAPPFCRASIPAADLCGRRMIRTHQRPRLVTRPRGHHGNHRWWCESVVFWCDGCDRCDRCDGCGRCAGREPDWRAVYAAAGHCG